MKRAALYVCGKIVTADTHSIAFESLTAQERSAGIISGAFDTDTAEFDSDMPQDHFFNKEMILIRHPETMDDGPNPHLSPEGIESALQIANNLRGHDLTNYLGLTSPMSRCLEAAKILCLELNITFQVEPQIVETPDFGDGQFRIENLSSHYPEFSWPTHDDIHVNKETNQEFCTRIKSILQKLPHRCILVTHFGVIYHISQNALCEEKAKRFFCTGIPRGSVAYIKRDMIELIGNHDENFLGD